VRDLKEEGEHAQRLARRRHLTIIYTKTIKIKYDVNNVIRAPFTWKSDELCNFQAPSICTNVLGLRPMGWSWRRSIQGSIVRFT
jgi:hypothetical protein